ncbi:MAG: metal-sensing transcriptional repressor [Clostridia bacterium]|nr:metal-sensing transcriptional repressor [Clostridia bacterium]
MDNNACCCERKKKRSEEEYRALINRLSRIEGQVRGVRSMIESDAYCIDVLNQVSAVSAALSAFSRELLSRHIHTCVREDIIKGERETLDELVTALSRLIK